MKILYVITGLGSGGAERVVVDLADKMFERGYQVKIALLKGPIIVRPRNSDIEIVNLGLDSIKKIKFSYNNYNLLIQNYKPDIVHAHMVHANIFARISRIFAPIPKLICTAHSNNEGGRGRMLAYRLTHHMSDLTTNVSLSASQNFINLGAVPKNGIRTIYNGINLDRFKKCKITDNILRSSLGLSDGDLMLLAVGRLHEAKDYPNLFNAFKILLNNRQNKRKMHLFVVGDGELRKTLEQELIESKLTRQIHFLGHRTDIPQLMSAADLFILSSKYEGFGLVVAEAMACETFVVATDCGGVKEVMGGFGTLVPKGNSKLLAEGIDKSISLSVDEIKRNNIGALEFIKKNLALNSIVEQWINLYEE